MGRWLKNSRVIGAAALLFCLLLCKSLPAQTLPATSSSAGQDLQVFLATMEPGDDSYERFGHDAIIILNSSTGEEWAYNYGVFDFDAPNFIGNFLRGKMTYWMARDPAGVVNRYSQQNRSVWLDELNLSPAQRLKLQQRLEWNLREENKYYRYDYYRDNCATRVRDALNYAVDGQIKSQLLAMQTHTTFRSHTRIGMAEFPLLYAGLELILGPQTDHPLTAWDDCFLPVQLMQQLHRVTIANGAGPGVPLIRRSTPFFKSTRTPLPDLPPRPWWIFLLMGCAIGGALLLAAQSGWRRTFLALTIAWSLVGSLACLVMLCMWMFTDHEATYCNENLLLFNPLWLAVLAAAVRGLRWRRATLIVKTAVAVAALGLLVKIVPWFIEWNWEIISLALPAHLGLAVGCRALGRRLEINR